MIFAWLTPSSVVQDKLAEEEAEKLKAEQKLDDDQDDGGEKLSLADRIIELFDSPPLDRFKDTAEPALDYLEEHPSLAWVIVALPVFLGLSVVRRLFGKKVRSGNSQHYPLQSARRCLSVVF